MWKDDILIHDEIFQRDIEIGKIYGEMAEMFDIISKMHGVTV